MSSDAGWRFAIGLLMAVAFVVMVVLVDAIGRDLGAHLFRVIPCWVGCT